MKGVHLQTPSWHFDWLSPCKKKKKSNWHMPIYPKVLKIPEPEIIGCSRVVVILSPKRSWASRKRVTDYCGVHLIGICLLKPAGVVLSWPLKLWSFSTQTGFHRIIFHSWQYQPLRASVCRGKRLGVESFSLWSVALLWAAWVGPSLAVTVTPRLVRNVCAHDCQIRRALFSPSPWASLQHHPWALFWSPRVEFS